MASNSQVPEGGHPPPPGGSRPADESPHYPPPVSSAADAAAAAAAVAAASDELAVAVRVRNRLASSVPDASLPRVLTALLPRILRNLERNAARLYGAERGGGVPSRANRPPPGDGAGGAASRFGEEEPNLRRRIDSELGGVVYHAEEDTGGG